jgi:hypothetical protein
MLQKERICERVFSNLPGLPKCGKRAILILTATGKYFCNKCAHDLARMNHSAGRFEIEFKYIDERRN